MSDLDPITYPSEIREGATGAGLWATADLPRGTAVARFTGTALPPREVPESEVRYALVLDGEHWLVPQSAARYVNHACDPNCYVDDDDRVITRRPVSRGEELTFDYARVSATEYFADPAAHTWDTRWTFKCECRSPQCRGMIDGYALDCTAFEVAAPAPMRVVQVAGKGRGVIAARAIAAGELLERSPVLVIPAQQWSQVEHTTVYDFTFEWGTDGADAAIVLGTGSIINHSYRPNAHFERRYQEGVVEFVALRAIAVGEEITVNYNGEIDDLSPLWFTPVG